MAGYCFFSSSSLQKLLGKLWGWSSCGARAGSFPSFLWSQEFSLLDAWVLGLADGQSAVLGHGASHWCGGWGMRCVGGACFFFFCAAGGAFFWAAFAACLLPGLFFCVHQLFMKGCRALQQSRQKKHKHIHTSLKKAWACSVVNMPEATWVLLPGLHCPAGGRGISGGRRPVQPHHSPQAHGRDHHFPPLLHPLSTAAGCCTSFPKSGLTLTVGSETYRPCPSPALELSPLILALFQWELKPNDYLGDITPHMLLIERVASQNVI